MEVGLAREFGIGHEHLREVCKWGQLKCCGAGELGILNRPSLLGVCQGTRKVLGCVSLLCFRGWDRSGTRATLAAQLEGLGGRGPVGATGGGISVFGHAPEVPAGYAQF